MFPFRFSKLKLRTKLLFFICSMNLLLILFTMFLVHSQLKKVILTETEKRAQSTAILFGSTVVNYLKLYNYHGIQQNAQIAKWQNSLSFLIVYDKDGLIAAQTEDPSLIGNRATGMDDSIVIHSNTPVFRQSTISNFSLLPQQQVFDLSCPIMAPDSNIRWGTVRLGISMQSMLQQLREMQIKMLQISALALITGMIGAVFLANRITTPIAQLVSGALQAASGDLSHPIIISTGDELQGLAEHFNYMIAQLHQQHEERLRQERMAAIGLMVNTIVHDCRAPISVIKGFATLFIDFDMSKEKIQEGLKLINFETDRMERMLEELLQFSSERKAPLALDKHNTDEFVRECMVEVRALFSNSSIAIHENLQCNDYIYIDADKLRRAILNIVTNARDALRGQGTFTVETSRSEDSSTISLIDSAGGIPESFREHLFDPFFTHGKKSGFGLGMAITKKIIEEHSGEITFESFVGKGTTFRIQLPLWSTLNE